LHQQHRPVVGLALRRAHHRVRQEVEAELRSVDLSLPLAGVLLQLDEEDGLSSAELARRETVTAQTMNQLVTRLVERGLVERRAHPTHGRILTLHLTVNGRGLLDEVLARSVAVEERMLSAVSAAERARLLRDLERCAEALDRP
jgi:DNA-binding MarR family transcriptional regulator